MSLGCHFLTVMAGVLVGIFGCANWNLQALFQAPGILIGFSCRIVCLAVLSMLVSYELQLPIVFFETGL